MRQISGSRRSLCSLIPDSCFARVSVKVLHIDAAYPHTRVCPKRYPRPWASPQVISFLARSRARTLTDPESCRPSRRTMEGSRARCRSRNGAPRMFDISRTAGEHGRIAIRGLYGGSLWPVSRFPTQDTLLLGRPRSTSSRSSLLEGSTVVRFMPGLEMLDKPWKYVVIFISGERGLRYQGPATYLCCICLHWHLKIGSGVRTVTGSIRDFGPVSSC